MNEKPRRVVPSSDQPSFLISQELILLLICISTWLRTRVSECEYVHLCVSMKNNEQ